MYKTTQSINPSSEKAVTYTKITLDEEHYYEGEVKNGQIEGNGILYTADHRVVYSGAWVDGKYEGFGTLNNLEWQNGRVEK